MMLGSEAVERLRSSHVAVFGVGGVGGYAAEALARAGVGKITLIDPDAVSVTNVNRQIIALRSTTGRNKAEVMRDRILDINPDCSVTALPIFFAEDTESDIDFSAFDYVVDAIDTVKSKLLIIKKAKEQNVPVISSMGAGNKLDPTRFRVTDIYKTSHDPLARAVRSELRRLGIPSLKVVYSDETPIGRREAGAPGSISFVPGAAGLALAGEVILDISDIRGK
ncbi:MAG: tRNA threonylcarbamoyladenosine dehydratase [Clostridia bacterium]|nr:tRNA threonylcarbamoyladenosine dehydratase [Clostridia bacterium]